MNVDDTNSPEVQGDRLKMIFDRQRELLLKYHEIEKKNGIGLGAMEGAFDIDSPKWQYLLKDYAWRVTEEIAESTEALPERKNLTHAQEEMADSLHFLIELSLIAGITEKDFPPSTPEGGDALSCLFSESYRSFYKGLSPRVHSVDPAFWVIEDLGRAMNCLKNKPWKLTHVETDVTRFRINIFSAFFSLMAYAESIEMNADKVFDFYFRKSNVNQFRQRSEY